LNQTPSPATQVKAAPIAFHRPTFKSNIASCLDSRWPGAAQTLSSTLSWSGKSPGQVPESQPHFPCSSQSKRVAVRSWNGEGTPRYLDWFEASKVGNCQVLQPRLDVGNASAHTFQAWAFAEVRDQNMLTSCYLGSLKLLR
jgi:hypothetical protein